MVKIKLKKCAYIFDGSNSNYFYGTKEQYERKSAVNKYLKTFYDNNEQTLDAEQNGGGFNILIDGKSHYIKPQMVESVDCEHILNHLTTANLKNFVSKNFKKFTYPENTTFYSEKFKTLSIEDFTTEKKSTLEYIRIKFKGNTIKLVKDDKNSLLWFDNYQEASEKEILKRLDLSLKAKKELLEVFDFLKK